MVYNIRFGAFPSIIMRLFKHSRSYLHNQSNTCHYPGRRGHLAAEPHTPDVRRATLTCLVDRAIINITLPFVFSFAGYLYCLDQNDRHFVFQFLALGSLLNFYNDEQSFRLIRRKKAI